MDDALRLIRTLGPRCHLLRMDLKDAYRVVPIHPDDQHQIGILWEGGVCVDCSLLFASIANALRLICSLGPRCYLLKMDLKDAYRVVLIHPDYQHLIGITWEGEV